MQKRSESNDADVARKKKLDEIESGLKRLADRLELEWGKLPPPSPDRGVLFIRGGISPASQLLKRAAVDAGRLLLEAFKLDLLPKARDVAQFKEVVQLPGDHFEQAFQVLRDDWLPLFGVSKPSSDLGAGYALADSIRTMVDVLTEGEDNFVGQSDTPKKSQKKSKRRLLDCHARACIKEFKQYVKLGERQSMLNIVKEYAASHEGVSESGTYKRLTDNRDQW